MSIDTATGKEAPADISSERVKDIFSTIAKKYERFNAVSSFGAYKTWLAGMMRQAPIDENADVLDIAGGTGDVTFTVARAKHPRHIQCTDLVDEMLDVARMHYEDNRATNAVAVWCRAVCDVYSTIQPGCHSSGTCASGHCVGDFALYADRLVSGSKRIFLYSELPYCSGCYQFRPYRDNKNRQVCVESFVHDARPGIDDCCLI